MPAPLGGLLRPVGALYGALGRLRAARYASGRARTARLAAPVVSVGNLTAGGSGKTPIVDWLLGEALRQGRRPAVLSRGYGRRGRADLIRLRGVAAADPEAVGDEPYWLAGRHPDVPVVLGRRRAVAGRLAETWDAPDLILLDDGFQHLPLARDLNLLLVDAARGLGNGRVLPAGWLREPPAAAARADAVILTGTDGGDPDRAMAALNGHLRPGTPVFRFGYGPAILRRLDREAEMPPERLAGREVALVCGIARPAGFVAAVEALGARVGRLEARPDHEPYGPAVLTALDRSLGAGSEESALWLTTEKDAVKLRGRLDRPERLWVLEMAVAPDPAWAPVFAEFLARHPGPGLDRAPGMA